MTAPKAKKKKKSDGPATDTTKPNQKTRSKTLKERNKIIMYTADDVRALYKRHSDELTAKLTDEQANLIASV